VKRWWTSLAARERYVLLVGTVVVLAALGYAMLWRPLEQSIVLNRARVAQLNTDLRWMQAASAKMHALQAVGQGRHLAVKGSLAMAVDASVRRHSLEKAVMRLDPQGRDTVGVSLSTVDFNVLLRWLGDLQMQGVAIRRLDLTPAAPGRVQATLQLVRAGER
jgi:general secretion pathway protein M